VFKRAKTVHALDRAVTVIGKLHAPGVQKSNYGFGSDKNSFSQFVYSVGVGYLGTIFERSGAATSSATL
jgi:hypothetical protein